MFLGLNLISLCPPLYIDSPHPPNIRRPLYESSAEETELEIRRLQKEDSIGVIHRVRIKPLA